MALTCNTTDFSLRFLLLVSLTMTWLSAATAQDSQDSEVADVRAGVKNKAESDARLKVMLTQASDYDLTIETDPPRLLQLHEQPLIRFNNPVSGVPDGVVVMWKDGARPAVIAQVFQLRDGQWLHEVQSMAPAPLTMQQKASKKDVWQPRDVGLSWLTLADVAVEGKTATARLIQMRNIAADFSAVDQFQVNAGDTDRSSYDLRLLPRPLYRYSDPGAGVIDAAVFAYVHGTDPEMFLVIEAMKSDEKTSWRYSLAPMTCWAVEAKYKGTDVWSVPERLNKSTVKGNYHVWFYRESGQ